MVIDLAINYNQPYGRNVIVDGNYHYEAKQIMIDDPIVAEVRKAREEYARRFNFDLDAICEDLKKKQMQSGRQLVEFEPKRPKLEIQKGRISS